MSNTIMCSLDTSTKKTGIATYINGELKDYTVIDFSKISNADNRIMQMGRDILKYLEKKKPEIIYIEDSKGKPNYETVKKLGKVIGIVLSYCIKNNVYVEQVSPNTWRGYLKEFNGIKGRENLKQAGIILVKNIFGIITNSDDLADAILLGYAMIRHYT